MADSQHPRAQQARGGGDAETTRARERARGGDEQAEGGGEGGEPIASDHISGASAYAGAVLDDPTLLEDAPEDFDPVAVAAAGSVPEPSNSSGWDDVLGSGSLLLKTLPNAEKDSAAASSSGGGGGGAEANSRAQRPQKGQQVTVSYTLTRLRSAVTKLDFASDAFEPPAGEPDEAVAGATGRIGEGDFITAIDMALQLMPGAGSRTAIRATARHCFNTAGKPGVFPPGADLYIELELAAVRVPMQSAFVFRCAHGPMCQRLPARVLPRLRRWHSQARSSAQDSSVFAGAWRWFSCTASGSRTSLACVCGDRLDLCG